MSDLYIFLKNIGLGALPFFAGVLVYGKDELLSKIIAILLFLFGMIIISILTYDHLETRKVRRRHLGYGDLK